MGALRKQMDDDMVVRGMAERTRETYLSAVAAMAKYYQRSPEQVSEVEVQRYLLHLIQERKLAWSSCNITVNALKFCYHVTSSGSRLSSKSRARASPEAASDPGTRRGRTLDRVHPQSQAPRHADDHLRGGAAGLGAVSPEGGRHRILFVRRHWGKCEIGSG